jgi:hypothetical protein
MYSLELGSEVANLTCGCCGQPFKSVCGFIKKDNWACTVYFATLGTGHDEISAGLTISIGKWWDDSDEAVSQREWVYMRVWPSESGSGFEVRLEKPESSRHVNTKSLGRKLEPDVARQNPLLDEFFSISDFIIDNDPAVISYLSGEEVNIAGRACLHE